MKLVKLGNEDWWAMYGDGVLLRQGHDDDVVLEELDAHIMYPIESFKFAVLTNNAWNRFLKSERRPRYPSTLKEAVERYDFDEWPEPEALLD